MASKEMYERVSHCDTGSAFSCFPIGNFFRLTTAFQTCEGVGDGGFIQIQE